MPISLLSIKQQKDKTVSVDEEIDIRPFIQNHTDIVDVDPLHFQGKAYALADLYVIEGQITGNLTLRCSRCLKEFSHRVDLPFKASFIESESDLDLDDESDIYEVEEEEIDIHPYVAEEVLLKLDPIPLCDMDCKGLCPVCGKDQNQESCECETETIDPRLADLAKFFERDEDGQSK